MLDNDNKRNNNKKVKYRLSLFLKDHFSISFFISTLN